MSTPIFPREIDIAQKTINPIWRTIVHSSARGIERRSVGLGPTDDIDPVRRNLEYIMNPEDPIADIELVADFKLARQGNYEMFLLPSFAIDSTFVAYVGGGPTVEVAAGDGSKFTDTQNAYGNWIYIWDVSLQTGELRRITSIAGDVLTINTTLSGSYIAGDYVEIATLVRFADPGLPQSSTRPDRQTLAPLQFVEVFEYGEVVI